jgi:hypothetical protein
MKPKRIQRKRTKGWKMPENTVMVGRPGKFGNPFRDIKDMVYYYSERRQRQRIDPWVFYGMKREEVNCISLFEIGCNDPAKIRAMVGGYDGILIERYFNRIKLSLMHLKGKDLACWCKIVDKNNNYIQCHADILLSLSNNLLLNDVKNENIREEKLLQKR